MDDPDVGRGSGVEVRRESGPGPDLRLGARRGRGTCLLVPLFLVFFACLVLAWVPPISAGQAELRYETMTAGPIEILYVPARKARAVEVARIASQSLARLARDLGLATVEDPIRIYLPPPGKEPRAYGPVPSWAAGYAVPPAGAVVLVWGRDVGYPDRSIRTLLDHELTHVLLYRATGGAPLPRWFDEGVAMLEARQWVFADSFHSWIGAIFHGEPSLSRLSEMFGRGEGDARTAYALSYAFMRHLTRHYGPDAPGRIVRAVASGKDFKTAFRIVTGRPLAYVEARWRRSAALRYKWIPVITSTTTLWVVITSLFLLVYWRKKRESQRIHDQWEAEDGRGPPWVM